jgi:hypothetical protein
VVERVCDYNWVESGKRRQCYKAVEAAEILLDEIPDADMPECRTREPSNPQKWNKY